MQGEPREGNDNRREHCLAADQPHGRAPTPPARGLVPDNNRRANTGANIGVNVDADAQALFWQASQNLAAAAMLLRGCPEPATSEERRVRQQLKALLKAAAAQQAKSSASSQRSERERAGAPSAHGPNPPPPSTRGVGRESEPRHLRSRVDSGPTVTLGTRSRLDDEPRVSTTIATIAHTTTTTVSAAGHQTSDVRGLLAGASTTRSSPRASEY
jgi:hypothetical protein